MTPAATTPRISLFSRLYSRVRARRWTWAHRLSQAIFLALLIVSSHSGINWLTGSTSATRVLGVLHLADPLSALEVTLASRQFTTSLLVAAGILFVLYALMGRAFCGWVCPLGLILDLTDDFRRRFITRRTGPRLPRQLKYILLGLFLVISLLTRVPAFTLISPINIFSRNLIFGFGPEIVLVIGIVAFDLFFSRRAWCRYLCPLGAFYSLIGRFPILHIRIRDRGATCTLCGVCTRDCPMGINVLKYEVLPKHSTVTDPECTRCGTCLDNCDGGTLHLGLASPRKK